MAVIVGANGLIWSGPLIPQPPLREDMDPDLPALAAAAAAALEKAGADLALRRRIAAVSTIARRSGALNRPVSAPLLAKMLQALIAADIAPGMLDDGFFKGQLAK